MTSMWPSDKEKGQEAAVKHALALANASPEERKAMEAADHKAYVERTRREARTMVQHLTLAQIDRLIAEREAAYNARYSFYSDLTDAPALCEGRALSDRHHQRNASRDALPVQPAEGPGCAHPLR